MAVYGVGIVVTRDRSYAGRMDYRQLLPDKTLVVI
jgi:hypothetical protein